MQYCIEYTVFKINSNKKGSTIDRKEWKFEDDEKKKKEDIRKLYEKRKKRTTEWLGINGKRCHFHGLFKISNGEKIKIAD